MTDKELIYLEDIYKHETLLVTYINSTLKYIKTDELNTCLNNQVKLHDKLLQRITKLIEGEAK